MLLLTKEELKSHQDANLCVIFVEKESEKSSLKLYIFRKLNINFTIQVNIEVQHMVFVILNLMCPMKSW